MVKCTFVLSLLCITLLVSNPSYSQSVKDDVEVAVKPMGKNLIVRWAPTTDKVWLKMKDGYVIVSYQSWTKGQSYKDRTPWQYSDTLRVWPKSKFSNIVNTPKENPYVMLAGYIMHEPYESLKKPGQDLASLIDRKDELTNRFSSGLLAADMDSLAAEAQCMRYVIKDFDPNKYYLINVHLYLDNLVLNNLAEYDPNATYSITPFINKYEELENSVILSWDKEIHSAYFTAYWIERSKDGNKFERLTESPYINAFDIQLEEGNDDFTYIDSIPNYQPYYYRLSGMDAFGYTSQPSKSIKLMARDKTPPPTPTNQNAEVISGKMALSWLYELDPDLHHFNIEYSQTYAGIYKPLQQNISKSDRKYIHQGYANMISNYYKVCALDSAENKACTTPFYGFYNDTIPPAKPINLLGKVDTLGHITLTWPLGKESDLKGYNVYFCNRYNGVFSILNHGVIQNNQFLDTINLNSLTKDIFYKITAVDVRDNISFFSDMARIIRPDTIPPGAAVFTNYKSTSDGILLEWANPPTSDLKTVELWRKNSSETWILIGQYSKETTKYTDTDLVGNTSYEYKLVTSDAAGLKTDSPNNVKVKSSYSKQDLSVEITAKQVENDISLELSTNTNAQQWSKITIYKAQKDKPFFTWKTVNDTSNFTINDTAVKPNETYQYKAYITTKEGIKSPYSETISITLKSE